MSTYRRRISRVANSVGHQEPGARVMCKPGSVGGLGWATTQVYPAHPSPTVSEPTQWPLSHLNNGIYMP